MKSKSLILILMVLLSILACVIPGISEPTSAPLDPASIPSIIAATANAAAAQTAAVAPPIPTDTPIPSPTATLPPVFSAYGTALLKQSDGSTLFIDRMAGYHLYFPPGWVVVRQNHDEYYSMWSEEAITYPFLAAELTLIRDQDPTHIRVHAFDVAPNHRQETYVSHIYVQWIEEKTDLKKEANDIIESFKAQDPNVNIIHAGSMFQTPNNVIMAIAEYTAEVIGSVQHEKFVAHDKRILFHADSGTVAVSLSIMDELKDSLIPDYDLMIGNIKLGLP